MSDNFDLIVIGSGPGGYVAAIRGAQLGLKVACIEKDTTLGGTCLNVGCIPSKALLESSERFAEAKKGLDAHGVKIEGLSLDLDTMLGRKDKIVKQLTGGIAMLFKKNKIERFEGLGKLAGGGKVEIEGKDGTQSISAKNILIATGSVPTVLPGLEMDYDKVGTSTEALKYPEVPAKLAVIGAGVIGLELGSVWARLGAEVTVLEYAPELLPFLDPELRRAALKAFKKQGLKMQFGVRVTGAKATADGAEVSYEDPKKGTQTLAVDRVLVAVGRRPNTEGLSPERAGVELDERGRVKVDHQFRTTAPGVWAIGDVIHGPMLAHKAEEEGVAAVETMAGQPGHLNYDAIPNIIYTHPEVATLGKNEAELKAQGVPFKTGSFPFMANGRAKALNDTQGMVKILAHEQSDRILGAQIVGPRAGDLIAELAIAVEFSASAEDVARSVHAHPTLAEVVKEAALAVGGRVIHI